MKIKRSVLERIIREELAAHAKALIEAQVEDAQSDNAEKEKGPPKDDKKAKDEPKKEPKKSAAPPADDAGAEPPDPSALPAPEEPADDELEKQAADATDGEEEADEVTGGKIADQLTGKTVQSISMEPKSKLLPGAQEIVVTFDQIPDPLRILVNKSGQVKFYFKGLHNEL